MSSKKIQAVDKAAGKIDELRAEIEEHNYRYHLLDDPVISDSRYDGLIRALEKLEDEVLQTRIEHAKHQLDFMEKLASLQQRINQKTGA